MREWKFTSSVSSSQPRGIECYLKLITRNDKQAISVINSFNRVKHTLKKNPQFGDPISKKLFPKSLIVKYNIQNLYRVELSNYWRLLYTIEGNEVHIYMTMIRSHFAPDNIEGIQVGDKVYFHVTNLEQDYDVPHGISMIGANTSELLIMPGQTESFVWEAKQEGVWPFYCTDFCSALHQEMQGYIRVSPKGSNVPISFTLDGDPVDIE